MLVMIGILLALQVNNWNEERKIKQTVKTYTQSLMEALDEDVTKMEISGNQFSFRYYSSQYLQEQAGEDTYDFSKAGVMVLKYDPKIYEK